MSSKKVKKASITTILSKYSPSSDLFRDERQYFSTMWNYYDKFIRSNYHTDTTPMNLGKSKNPMFGEKAIAKAKALELERRKTTTGGDLDETDDMTVSGAVNKTVLLLGLLTLTALYSYTSPSQIFMPIGALGAAAVFFVTSFKPHLAPMTAPLFAVLE